MTDGNDLFDRNLERLIRAAADPPPDAGRARRGFLARAGERAPSRDRMGRMMAMAASLFVAAAILYSAFQPRVPGKAGESQVQSPTSKVDAPPIPPEGKGGEPRANRGPKTADPAPARASGAMTAEDGAMTLACTPPSPRSAEPVLRFEGTVPYPDRTTLKIAVLRLEERYAAGRLVPGGVHAGGGLSEVNGKRFGIAPPWQGPGRYQVTVTLDESQRPELAEALKTLPRRPFAFEFSAWGAELAGQLEPRLREFTLLLLDTQDLLSRIEKLSAQESAWIKERKNVDQRGADIVLTREAQDLVKELGQMKSRIEAARAKSILPAAHGELFFTVQSLHGNAERFHYEAGKFAGARSYHSGGDALKTHRGELFRFEALRKYVDEAEGFAAREAALWIAKDLLRGGAREAYAGMLVGGKKETESMASFRRWAGRLTQAAPGELAALEAEIRSGKP